MGYIYKIYNDINEKIYIGQTSKARPTDRWSQHKSDSKNLRNGDNSAIHLAMNKYGNEHFFFEIIEEVDNSKLDEREIFWITKENSQVPNGYNISSGGSVPRGFISRGRGIPRTEKVKQKLREAWTPEMRKAMSERMNGEGNPQYGKHLSEETKRKLSLANSGINNPQFGIQRCGEENPFYGKHHSEETKKKLSQSQNSRKKKVVMKDRITNEIIQEFESLSAAARYIKGDDGFISKACRHKANKSGSNTAYGYNWDFVESVSTNCSEEISTSRSEVLSE